MTIMNQVGSEIGIFQSCFKYATT